MPTRAALAGFALAAVLLLGPAAPAALAAAQYDLDHADIELRLTDDAALAVTERLTFNFQTRGKGAWRDVPVTIPGFDERVEISDIQVSDDVEGEYRPGGNTELGSEDSPGRFGEITKGELKRIVWHYRADPGLRTFTVSYVARGATVAYDDIVDVNWKVWGDQWDRGLGALTATLVFPPGVSGSDQLVRVYGHSKDFRADGTSAITADGLTLQTSGVPGETWVELRGTVPRSAFGSVAGAHVEPGDGLGKVVQQEQDFAAQKRWFKVGSLIIGTVPAALVALLLGLALYRRRELRVDSVPEYLSVPPSEDIPLVAQLLANEGIEDVNRAHLATLFDLVRRRYYTTDPKRNSDDDLDLELAVSPSRPDAGGLSPYEMKVLDFFDNLLESGPGCIGDLPERVPEHSATWRQRWEGLQTAAESRRGGRTQAPAPLPDPARGARSGAPRWLRLAFGLARQGLVPDHHSFDRGHPLHPPHA